jgi:flagellar biogenesis protein FliO
MAFAAAAWAQPVPSPSPDPMLDAIAQRMAGSEAVSIAAAETAEAADRNLPSLGGLLLRLAGALILTLGGLYGALVLLKRFLGRGGATASPHIRVLAKSFLSNKSAVYLVEIAGKILVVGESSGGLALLTSLDSVEGLLGSGRGANAPGEAGPLSAFTGHLGRIRSELESRRLSSQLREGALKAQSLTGRVGGSGTEPPGGSKVPE